MIPAENRFVDQPDEAVLPHYGIRPEDFGTFWEPIEFDRVEVIPIL